MVTSYHAAFLQGKTDVFLASFEDIGNSLYAHSLTVPFADEENGIFGEDAVHLFFFIAFAVGADITFKS